ncbi:MAG: hypothetical protein AVDCRST_MAG19-2558, partial [uncultured Thermomicrobiales bacterium]
WPARPPPTRTVDRRCRSPARTGRCRRSVASRTRWPGTSPAVPSSRASKGASTPVPARSSSRTSHCSASSRTSGRPTPRGSAGTNRQPLTGAASTPRQTGPTATALERRRIEPDGTTDRNPQRRTRRDRRCRTPT